MRWVCVYDPWDGSPLVRVTSDDLGFEDLPNDGIFGITKYFADGTRMCLTGYEWYFSIKHPSGETIISGNSHTLEDNFFRYPNAIWKRGKHTPDRWCEKARELLLCAD